MRKLVSILAALAIVALCASGAMAEGRLDKILAAGKITVATSPDFAPVEFIDPNKQGQDSIVGAEMSLARYIAEQLGVELVIESMDFSAVQGAVTQGKVDLAISGFSATDERREAMELSDYYNFTPPELDGQGLLIRKADAEKYTKLEDFAGKKVAVQNASLQYNLVTSQLPDSIPEYITNLNDAVMMLITGKVEAVASATDVGKSFAVNYPDLQMADCYFDWFDEGNVLAATKGESDLMAKVNEILKQAEEQGLYFQWWDEANALSDSLGVNAE